MKRIIEAPTAVPVPTVEDWRGWATVMDAAGYAPEHVERERRVYDYAVRLVAGAASPEPPLDAVAYLQRKAGGWGVTAVDVAREFIGAMGTAAGLAAGIPAKVDEPVYENHTTEARLARLERAK
jgi:hypothetical protein